MSTAGSVYAADSARGAPSSSVGRKTSMATSADSLSARVMSEISVIGSLTLNSVVEFPDEECMVVRLSHDKALWAVGLSSGKIQFFTTESCTLVYSLDPPERKENETVTGLVFVPPDPSSQKTERQHLILACYATGQVRLWHYTGVANPLLWTLQVEALPQEGESHPQQQSEKSRQRGGKAKESENQQLLCLACSPDSQRFVVGGVGGEIRVYEFRRHNLINVCQSSYSVNRVDGHRNRVCALLYHPLGRQMPADYGHVFLSGGWDNTVQIWDDRRGHSLWVYFGPHVCGTDALDIDPLQNHILTSSWERHRALLQVWKFQDEAARGRVDLDEPGVQEDMLKGRPLGELQQDPLTAPSMGYVAQWLGDQYMLFAGSNANLLKIVDRGTLNMVASVSDLPKGVYSVAPLLPDSSDSRKPAKLSVCSGNRLYTFRFERK
ncbi:hypothetical protein BOX15_Mlig028217g1 [Macrostomum lignano]|uniref:Uncharacterized protein n=1 Tax=Macrostomum lignano TaxID=282301 RepID=A0A267GX91_9PLAT|nr:hypothetical protein BOX15_Mlig028217g1 [Macrostomum lignano]